MRTGRWIVGGAFVAMAVLGIGSAALADGGGGGGGSETTPARGTTTPGNSVDPEYTAAVRQIKADRFASAIPLLEGVVARDGKNADAYNWLAYATRRNGDVAGAIPIYQKALALNPKHLGAYEYLGEAYLTLDDLPKAKEQLAALDRLCRFGCSQYRDLRKAVDTYEKSGGKTKPQKKADW